LPEETIRLTDFTKKILFAVFNHLLLQPCERKTQDLGIRNSNNKTDYS